MTTESQLRGVAFAVLLSFLPSCRGVSKLIGDRDAVARGNIHWANSFGDEVDNMPSADKRTVFVASIRNTSGSEIDTEVLTGTIRDSVAKRGWRVLSSPTEAAYQLSVILHYWGENPNPDAGDWALKHAREVLAVAGAVGGAASADNWREFVVRGAAGGVVGGVVGTAVRNHSRANEWNLVLETRLEERVEGQVANAIENSRSADQGHGNTSSSGDGGSHATSVAETTTSKQEFRSVRDRFRHRNVLVGYARQIKMTEQEAMDFLVPKLERALPGILP